ncbi:reverse transcriptase [Gossypium australe]|uniref:Reverse transcriptase n=1 Tax=Gossypium australe TaxID=47621 RepID=A0A5B6VVY6_9ROSI|nr:reverse transcriptase [Gossypium australe]
MSLEKVNFTNIILIPKVFKVDMMSLFQPISLCSILYKIISKVIANRLKLALDRCIDEVLHTLKMRHKGKKESFALILDMSKAYDRME